MVRNGIFWTIGKHLYFVYYPIISYQRIKFYSDERMDMGRSHCKQWCQWDGSHIQHGNYYGAYCTR